ncbi:carboxymuconolactone decarboxylase family protein [Kocuria marina]|uniref:carboxymuconolactone decarboxylase family protein n=1 Tax=Kocuria TaxID=57493 RepID=UPI0007EAF684|nr:MULTISPECIES: carboxymuconolactone decarboxylase family protein [Kocuria]MCT1722801.1 carboxymuconolactone decarboxylase family protein [Kocuria marina]MCT1733823.1 carboxymuconolactone decarboxylase family protein [Kocuria marina]OBA49890.1 carboxymuconolactone decarboxylase [Kocuria sp. ICS0012]
MTEQDRFFLDKSDPSSWRAVNAFSRKVGAAAEDAGIPASVVELVNVRVSQLNGCAFCLDLHVRKAEAAGVTAQQLAVLPAWRDTVLFNAVERAALIIAETATLLPDENTRHAEQAAAREALNDEQYSALQWTAIAINAFNRISILSGHPVRPRKTASAPAGATTSTGGAR